ncbi:hypothetical protein HY418_03640 [Candidatus Kaiserbacteria bacterium]|nr:hypothetical protein [Candidatus Kaiserbacteria bacterium]
MTWWSRIHTKSFIGIILVASVWLAMVAYYNAPAEKKVITLEAESLDVLPPHEHDPSRDSVADSVHHYTSLSQVFVPAEDVWISKIEFEVVNAPDTVLHHALLHEMDAQDAFCPPTPSRFGSELLSGFGADQMHTPFYAFPEGYALRIPAGKAIRLDATLHNPLPPIGPGGTYHDVQVRARLHLVEPGRGNSIPLSSKLLYVQDVPCGKDFVFTIPPNSTAFNTRSDGALHNPGSSMTFEHSARIVYWFAHLHGSEGGRELIVRKNNQEIARFKMYQDPHDPYRWNTPHDTTDITLGAGDVLSIEAVYDNPSDESVQGAMGMLLIYFAER